MSKDKLQLLSPLFLKYQSDFEKNPNSRVFAPLAETYRKLGMTDKAMEILSHGIRVHPAYLMGYLGLAFCYYDLKQFNLAYSTMKPLVESNRDNLRLLKLFSDVCLELEKKEEALETLKYLLFINPRDKEIAELVLRVEREVDNKYKPQHKPIIIPEKDLTSEGLSRTDFSLFNLKKLENAKPINEDGFDDWKTVDLSLEAPDENYTTSTNYDQWNVKKGDERNNLVKETVEEKVEENFERGYHVHLDLEEDSDPFLEVALKETFKPEIINNSPLVTHTLVDLYCGQGHIEKALEVLEKILLLNPTDQKTIKKIKEIQALVQPLAQYDEIEPEPDDEPEDDDRNNIDFILHYEEPKVEKQANLVTPTQLEEVSEEEGRRNLMSIFDEKLGPIEIVEDNSRLEVVRIIEAKLTLFLKKIQKRALDYQASV
ncbi:MAG: tetratricopeptide repeat protein [Bacteriovorax sp.]|nr:tetratricopeptide repeat protein [Bacteriovorax sp.]